MRFICFWKFNTNKKHSLPEASRFKELKMRKQKEYRDTHHVYYIIVHGMVFRMIPEGTLESISQSRETGGK